MEPKIILYGTFGLIKTSSAGLGVLEILAPTLELELFTVSSLVNCHLPDMSDDEKIGFGCK